MSYFHATHSVFFWISSSCWGLHILLFLFCFSFSYNKLLFCLFLVLIFYDSDGCYSCILCSTVNKLLIFQTFSHITKHFEKWYFCIEYTIFKMSCWIWCMKHIFFFFKMSVKSNFKFKKYEYFMKFNVFENYLDVKFMVE